MGTRRLDVHPPMRVVAVPRTRVTPPVRVPIGMMATTAHMRLLIIAEPTAVEEGAARRDEERNDVDNGQCKTRLEHSTALIRPPVDIDARPARSDIAQLDSPVGRRGGDGGAVGGGDAAEVVDGGDEGAEEGEVDEGDEVGVAGGAGVGEEGEHGPGEGEGGDDEEDEDRGWCEGVCFCEALDEPGEHTHDGDQGDDLPNAVGDEEECEEHDGQTGGAHARALCLNG
jgi:hypothetical protein